MTNQEKIDGFAVEVGKRNIQARADLTDDEYVIYAASVMGLILTNTCKATGTGGARKLTAKIITAVADNINRGE